MASIKDFPSDCTIRSSICKAFLISYAVKAFSNTSPFRSNTSDNSKYSPKSFPFNCFVISSPINNPAAFYTLILCWWYVLNKINDSNNTSYGIRTSDNCLLF